jgi:hypothetical protein
LIINDSSSEAKKILFFDPTLNSLAMVSLSCNFAGKNMISFSHKCKKKSFEDDRSSAYWRHPWTFINIMGDRASKLYPEWRVFGWVSVPPNMTRVI